MSCVINEISMRRVMMMMMRLKNLHGSRDKPCDCLPPSYRTCCLQCQYILFVGLFILYFSIFVLRPRLSPYRLLLSSLEGDAAPVRCRRHSTTTLPLYTSLVSYQATSQKKHRQITSWKLEQKDFSPSHRNCWGKVVALALAQRSSRTRSADKDISC
jgi:hypothetical protein